MKIKGAHHKWKEMHFDDTFKDGIMYSQSSLDIYVWTSTPNSEMGSCIGYVLSLPRQPSTNLWKFLMTEWFWGLDFWIIVTFTIFSFLYPTPMKREGMLVIYTPKQ